MRREMSPLQMCLLDSPLPIRWRRADKVEPGSSKKKQTFSRSLGTRLAITTRGDGSAIHHPKGCDLGRSLGLLKPANRKENLCIHTQIDNADITYRHENKKNKKIITIKPSIQIKFGLHHYFCYEKIFKIRPHLPISTRYFLKIVFNIK